MKSQFFFLFQVIIQISRVKLKCPICCSQQTEAFRAVGFSFHSTVLSLPLPFLSFFQTFKNPRKCVKFVQPCYIWTETINAVLNLSTSELQRTKPSTYKGICINPVSQMPLLLYNIQISEKWRVKMNNLKQRGSSTDQMTNGRNTFRWRVISLGSNRASFVIAIWIRGQNGSE
jgi:hypothetical protein